MGKAKKNDTTLPTQAQVFAKVRRTVRGGRVFTDRKKQASKRACRGSFRVSD